MVKVDGKSLRLSIRSIGSVPSLKNAKMVIFDREKGHMRPLTEPRVQKWMAKATRLLRLQLIFAFQQTGSPISTEDFLRFLTFYVPADDRRQIITDLEIHNVQVELGQEGADILIERLPDKEPMLFPD